LAPLATRDDLEAEPHLFFAKDLILDSRIDQTASPLPSCTTAREDGAEVGI